MCMHGRKYRSDDVTKDRIERERGREEVITDEMKTGATKNKNERCV